jgi:hypothetical protein
MSVSACSNRNEDLRELADVHLEYEMEALLHSALSWRSPNVLVAILLADCCFDDAVLRSPSHFAVLGAVVGAAGGVVVGVNDASAAGDGVGEAELDDPPYNP